MLMAVVLHRRLLRSAALHRSDHVTGQIPKCGRGGGAGIEHDDRLTLVAPDHDFRIDGDLAEERNAEHLRGLAATAVSEDLFPLAAVTADEVAHVLHDPEDRDVDFPEHGEPLARID